MKLIDQELKNLRGNNINHGRGDITLFGAIETSLLACSDTTTPDEKKANYKLAKLFVNTKEAEVEIEDLAIIKACIGKFMLTDVMGACYDILEK